MEERHLPPQWTPVKFTDAVCSTPYIVKTYHDVIVWHVYYAHEHSKACEMVTFASGMAGIPFCQITTFL